MLAALIVILFSLICATVFSSGLPTNLATSVAETRIAQSLIIVGVMIFIMESMVSIALVPIAAPGFVQAGAEVQRQLELPIQTLMQFRNNGAILGSTVLGLGAMSLGWLVRGGKTGLPIWMAWFALVGGLAGVLGVLTPMLSAFSPIRQGGLIALPLWAAMVSVLRSNRHACQ